MMRLKEAVHDAVERGGRRPGLLVIGAANAAEVAIAAAGSPPLRCPPERALFEVGSVTKVFTALLLAIAVKRGEVNLDDPVVDHLPEGTRVPHRDGIAITLEHLATHTATLPRLPPGLFWHALRHRQNPYADLAPADVLAALGKTRLRRTLGRRLSYSNFGAGVLGLALAHTAGVDYETLVRDRVTRPLGLTDTVITLDDEQRTRLTPGTTRRGKPAAQWTIPGLAGAGALHSTVSDLVTFVRAQMGFFPPSAPEELVEAIPSTHRVRARGGRLTPALRTGLGWLIIPIGREKVEMLWHNGGTGGYRSFVGWTPTASAAAIVLSANARSVDHLGTRMLKAIHG